MKIYMVGGAVRDKVMGIVPKDVDYVVVGASPADMEALGYEQVGADFPVFLHPVTRDEYALARTERKTGVGYSGFETTFDPSITLEDDLIRRDLTINAMAMDLETGEIIDPYGGQAAISSGVLRHTSEAFAEDPVRVLRTARFAARYGFKIHPETKVLMSQVAHELSHVPTERIWAEFEKGLSEKHASKMLEALYECGALKVDALRPYSKCNFGKLAETTDKTPFHVKFTLVSRGFSDQDYQTQSIPTAYARASKLFNRNFDNLVFYYFLEPEKRVDVLTNMRAFSSTEQLHECLASIRMHEEFVAIQDIGKGKVNTSVNDILEDMAKIRANVDAEQVAKDNPKHVKQALRSARIAAITQ